MTLPAGTRFGPYEILSLVAVGGMGEVYKARDTRLGREVAMKVLPSEATTQPDRVARFEREARAAAALNHPNICAIFDAGFHDGVPFIVSELLHGETLREVLTVGPLSSGRAIDYAAQVARALAVAHHNGIVHRDLKPENLFVAKDGRVKILDFGIVQRIEDSASESVTQLASARLTGIGSAVGTVGYMSPEQIRGLGTDSRSDIFSLGTVLFEMLAGSPPFRGDTAADTTSAILREDPPALPNNRVPPVLERIIRRCLEKAPDNRFQSADDLAFALEAVSGTTTATTVAVAGPPKRRRWLVGALSLAALLSTVILALFLWTVVPSSDLRHYRFVPFATDAEPEGQATWSPDGRSIAYIKMVAGRRQIWVRTLGSDSGQQLTQGSPDTTSLFWWPESQAIGFVSSDKVWRISRAGGEPEVMQGERVAAATLSPDGSTLALWRIVTDGSGVTASVWLASPPSATPTAYAPAPFQTKGDYRPAYLQFSPDGRTLLLTHLTDKGELATWLLPAAGRRTRKADSRRLR